jgi:hypothetical protein
MTNEKYLSDWVGIQRNHINELVAGLDSLKNIATSMDTEMRNIRQMKHKEHGIKEKVVGPDYKKIMAIKFLTKILLKEKEHEL